MCLDGILLTRGQELMQFCYVVGTCMQIWSHALHQCKATEGMTSAAAEEQLDETTN